MHPLSLCLDPLVRPAGAVEGLAAGGAVDDRGDAFAANDGAGLGYRRAMSGFRFYADTDNDNIFETLLVDQAINHDYNSGQAGDVDLANNELEMEFLFGGTVMASHWKYEVIQGQSIGGFEGVRVQELDAIATAVPEPASLALMSLGLVGLGFTKRRKA